MTREPTDERKSDISGVRSAVFVVICLIGAYLAGYVMACKAEMPIPGMRIRTFRLPFVARLYPPLAWFEAKLSGNAAELRAIRTAAGGGGKTAFVEDIYFAKP